jgi:hypothetical protein
VAVVDGSMTQNLTGAHWISVFRTLPGSCHPERSKGSVYRVCLKEKTDLSLRSG